MKDSRNRVYIVAEYVDGARNSTGYYWHKLISGLARTREGICVISTKVSCDLVDKSDATAMYIPVSGSGDIGRNGTVSRVVWHTILSLRFCIAMARHVRRNDLVFSGTNPAFMIGFISIFKRVIGFRWVLLVHEVFPENLVPSKILSRRSLAYRILDGLFSSAYSSADALIAIGRDMKELLVKKVGKAAVVEYIPNWVDLMDIREPVERSTIDILAQAPKKIRFQFFGNMGPLQGLDTILNAIEMVVSSKAAYSFIGTGAMESVVKEFIATHPGLDITHSRPLPFERNSEALFACDVALIPLVPGMFGLGVPSKAYFSLAADKPVIVIGDSGSELQRLVAENPGVGWYCPAGQPRELAALIDKICDGALTAETGKAKSLVSEKYSYVSAVEQYSELLTRIEKLQ